MTASSPHKLHNLQSLRGIAALLVVFTHMPSMELKHGGDSILPVMMRFGISGVDLFFVISGFVMVYVTWTARRSGRDSLKFLFARLTRIYPIYWLIAVAVFMGWMIKPSLMNYDPAQTNIVKSFLLWPDATFPMLKVAWTLIHELYFYLIFALILLLPKRFLMPALLVWVLFVTFGERAGLGALSPETAIIFHPLGMEFFFGAVAGWLYKISGAAAGRMCLVVGGVLWAVAIYHLSTAFADTFYPSNWERVLYFGLPSALVVYGMAASERQGWQMPKWSSRFGDWSYSLYLSHILTLSVLGYMWRPFAQAGPVDNVIAIIVLTLGCIAASAVLWYGFERPVLNYFRVKRRQLFPPAQS